MATLRLLLTVFVVLSGWLPINDQAVTGRYREKVKHPAPRVAYVSVCESHNAYAYHSGMCRGLARCTHGVSQVSEAQARKRGYVPCKICY